VQRLVALLEDLVGDLIDLGQDAVEGKVKVGREVEVVDRAVDNSGAGLDELNGAIIDEVVGIGNETVVIGLRSGESSNRGHEEGSSSGDELELHFEGSVAKNEMKMVVGGVCLTSKS